jgi:hypothetical protein
MKSRSDPRSQRSLAYVEQRAQSIKHEHARLLCDSGASYVRASNAVFYAGITAEITPVVRSVRPVDSRSRDARLANPVTNADHTGNDRLQSPHATLALHACRSRRRLVCDIARIERVCTFDPSTSADARAPSPSATHWGAYLVPVSVRGAHSRDAPEKREIRGVSCECAWRAARERTERP